MSSLAERLEALPVLDSLQREENPLSNGGRWESAGAGNVGKATSTGLVSITAGQEVRVAYVGAPFPLAVPCACAFALGVLPAEAKGLEIAFREAGGKEALCLTIVRSAAAKATLHLEVNEVEVKLLEGVTLEAGDTFYISIEGGTCKIWRKPAASPIVELISVAAAVGASFANVKLHVFDTGTTYRVTNFAAGTLEEAQHRLALLGVGA